MFEYNLAFRPLKNTHHLLWRVKVKTQSCDRTYLMKRSENPITGRLYNIILLFLFAMFISMLLLLDYIIF